MSTTKTKGKISPLFIALTIVTIALSSWGLYRLFVDFADAPGWLAILAVGGLDIVAVLCGKFALTVASDGDSSGPWNALLLLFTALAAFAQFSHALLAGQPLVIGVTMAAFPIATVILFEGQLRRKARLEGRARGLVPPPRATVPLIIWIMFPKVAMRATRMATWDRNLTGDDALLYGEASLAHEAEQEQAVIRRNTVRRAYPELEPYLHQVAAAPDAVTEGRAAELTERLDVPTARGDVARAVDAVVAGGVDGFPDVKAKVLDVVPTASDDAIRKAIVRSKERAVSNGHRSDG